MCLTHWSYFLSHLFCILVNVHTDSRILRCLIQNTPLVRTNWFQAILRKFRYHQAIFLYGLSPLRKFDELCWERASLSFRSLKDCSVHYCHANQNIPKMETEAWTGIYECQRPLHIRGPTISPSLLGLKQNAEGIWSVWRIRALTEVSIIQHRFSYTHQT